MARIYAKHEPYTTGHLGDVTAEMDCIGAPTIRAIWADGELFALEGSHRLAACHHLGLTPLILVEQPDLPVCTQDVDRLRAELPYYDMTIVAMSAAIA